MRDCWHLLACPREGDRRERSDVLHWRLPRLHALPDRISWRERRPDAAAATTRSDGIPPSGDLPPHPWQYLTASLVGTGTSQGPGGRGSRGEEGAGGWGMTLVRETLVADPQYGNYRFGIRWRFFRLGNGNDHRCQGGTQFLSSELASVLQGLQ